jgi:hypothetical protein
LGWFTASTTTSTRGWLIGHFIDPSAGVRATGDVEAKWAHHPIGDRRATWTSCDQRTTLVPLISGKFRIDLTDGRCNLNRPGDYVMWGPGVDHSWQALAGSTVVAVRWPSF